MPQKVSTLHEKQNISFILIESISNERDKRMCVEMYFISPLSILFSLMCVVLNLDARLEIRARKETISQLKLNKTTCRVFSLGPVSKQLRVTWKASQKCVGTPEKTLNRIIKWTKSVRMTINWAGIPQTSIAGVGREKIKACPRFAK